MGNKSGKKMATGCIVYQHCDFSGWQADFPAGRHDMSACQRRGMRNDELSSIVVHPGFICTLFQHGDFKGWQADIPAGRWNMSQLQDQFGVKNDDASSLILRRVGGNGCTIYQHGDFSGWEANFPAGRFNMTQCQQRGFKNDDMSSIVVNPGFQVTIYQHGNFSGWEADIPAGQWSMRQLESRFGFKNDDASSIVCKRVGGGGVALYARAMGSGGDGNGCIIYQHGDFSGWEAYFPAGRFNMTQCQQRGFKNDDMSSIIVNPGFQVTIYEHGNFSGWEANIPAGRWNMKQLEIFGVKNDDASSIVCKRV